MASRRIAKSAVDWAAFMERVPAHQKDAFRAFKQRSDNFAVRVAKYPEVLPAIDFAQFKARLSNPALVDQFEKQYNAVKVPYPVDKDKVISKVDGDEKAAGEVTKQTIADCQKAISDAKALLGKIDSLPPITEMTHEMYADYFPDEARNPWERPTFWPHTKSYQPENDPDIIK